MGKHQKFTAGLKELGVVGGASTVSTIVWEAGVERLLDKATGDNTKPLGRAFAFGGARAWGSAALEAAFGIAAGPALAMWFPRLGLGLGVGMATSGAKRLLSALTMRDDGTSAVFGQVVIEPLGAVPTQVPYSPTPVTLKPGDTTQRTVLLGEGEGVSGGDMGEASSTAITAIGGFNDASPVLLERVMAAIA